MNVKDLPGQGELAELFEAQKRAFEAQPMPDAAQRREWLSRLEQMLRGHGDELAAAISEDFGHRPADETRLLEIFPLLESIAHARRHLRRWMRPEARRTGIWYFPGRSRVRYQPLGVVGVMAPWNYPLLLLLRPLVGALAAGNRAMLKVSEYSPAFGALIARLIADRFPADLVTVVLGNAQIAASFAGLSFDHLVFTGSTEVGRSVMATAARNLTPLTLELGGKSPVVIAPGFDVETAAARIVLAKLINAGQTCIAPDYVLLPEAQREEFVAALRRHAAAFYGDMDSPDYASIAHQGHLLRLQAWLEEARAAGARIEPLLAGEARERRLVPVAVLGELEALALMRDEIFGPILPVLGYAGIDEAVAFINRRPRPLALYLFDNEPGRRKRVLDATASGGVTINDCLLHIAQDDLPFGGVGASGMGRYVGRDGFLSFSQQRPVHHRARLSGLRLVAPPFGRNFVQRLMRWWLR